MQALSVTEGAVWGGGLHAADTRAKMFVSLLASVATVALSGVEPQMVLFGMSLVYALGMRQFRILLIGYAVLVGMSLLAMGCAFGMSLLIPSMPAFSAVSLVVPFLRMATMLNVILPLAFSMSTDAGTREACWRAAADAVEAALDAGDDVALVNLGDVSLYDGVLYSGPDQGRRLRRCHAARRYEHLRCRSTSRTQPDPDGGAGAHFPRQRRSG